MPDFTYGPVDLIVAAFDGDAPAPSVLAALAEQVDAGLVRLLDMLIVRRDDDGELTFEDIGTGGDLHPDFAGVELVASGLVSNEDAEALASDLMPGGSAAVVALELTWAIQLASRLAESGGVVLETMRIPAPVVNAVLETAQLA